MQAMSTTQRLLLFLSPLLVAVLLLWVPFRDALETGAPEEVTYEVNVPEGHHWVAFTVPEESAYPTDGAKIKVVLEFATLEGVVGPDNRTLLFDLGEEEVQEVIVEWPDGRKQRFPSVELEELHEIRYPKNINVALAEQWSVRGPLYRFWGWAGLTALVLLFGLRVLSWAMAQEPSHA